MEDTITLRTGEQSTYSHPEQAAKLTQHAEDEVKPPGPFSCCMGGGGQQSESTQAIVPQQKKPDPPRRQRSMVCAMPKLGACLLLDALGDATYCAPGVGELGDLVFGPASAALKRSFPSPTRCLLPRSHGSWKMSCRTASLPRCFICSPLGLSLRSDMVAASTAGA